MIPDERRAKPVVFLAFADEQEGRRYLRQLPEEQRRLRAILRKAERLCEVEVLPNATGEEIAKAFARLGPRVVIFHYGGHAGPDGLLVPCVNTSNSPRRSIHRRLSHRWEGYRPWPSNLSGKGGTQILSALL